METSNLYDIGAISKPLTWSVFQCCIILIKINLNEEVLYVKLKLVTLSLLDFTGINFAIRRVTVHSSNCHVSAILYCTFTYNSVTMSHTDLPNLFV